MQRLALGDILSGFRFCDDHARNLLVPLFTEQCWPRGRTVALAWGGWPYLCLLAEGYVRCYTVDGFEERTLGVVGPGHALPPVGYFGGDLPSTFMESLGTIRLYLLDVSRALCPDAAHADTVRRLLLESYDKTLCELGFWTSLLHMPHKELRYAALQGRKGHLIGNVADRVLAASLNISWRHFVRLKNA